METSAAASHIIRVFPSRSRAEESGLVLAAEGIPYSIEAQGREWWLRVPAPAVAQASQALAAYARDQLASLPRQPAPVVNGSIATGIVVALTLVGFYMVTSGDGAGARWLVRGSASAARMFDGEWWRVVTALTLHADLSHLLNNAVTFAIFGGAVCHWFGAGVGLALILSAAAAGNGLNALVRGAPHTAIGASTAVFAAVGILAAVQFRRRAALGGRSASRRVTWAPLTAGLALLAFLGSSQHADVLAHLFGFACGAVAGGMAMTWLPQPVERRVQHALVVAVLATVAAAWALALSQ